MTAENRPVPIDRGVPPHPNMGDFVDMVETALRQTAVDRQDKRRDAGSF